MKIITPALIIITTIVSTILYTNWLPVSESYKQWRKATMLSQVKGYNKLEKDYANLYSHLNHEVRFLFEYAQALTKSSRYEESNHILSEAMHISCDPMLYNIMGKNYQAMKEYKLAEESFIISSYIVPSRLYPYYLLAKLYAETGDNQKAYEMATIVVTKEPKVHSQAVEEMRKEMKELCNKHNNQ